MLTETQIDRYSRQIILPEIGGKGQEKLLASRVLIIGAGGLGSPAALYLAAAGIGHLGIVDSDEVELSNLQRQILHTTRELGINKTLSAQRQLAALNPDIMVTAYPARLDANNILPIIRNYDIVLDGTDNFETKYLINDTCVQENIPYVHGGILRYDGHVMTILPGKSACFRCLFPAAPEGNDAPTCAQAGILGAIAGVVGSLQAVETLKYLLGIGELLTDKLLVYNARDSFFRHVKVPVNPDCAACRKLGAVI